MHVDTRLIQDQVRSDGTDHIRQMPLQDGQIVAIAQAIAPEDRPLVAEARRQALHTHQPCDVEFRIRPDAGPERWMHLRATTFYTADGQPQRSVGSVQDITDRRRAEHEMRLAASVFETAP